jgi:hypothetical protein
MVPYRVCDRVFTYFTEVAVKLSIFSCVEHLMKSINMAFVSFIKPAGPGL